MSVVLLSACQSNSAGTRPVYGEDTRREMVYADPLLCRVGSATAAIFDRAVLTQRDNEEQWRYREPRNLSSQGWCSSERFARQEAQAFCTAFLIASDRLATAGHCVNAIEDAAGPGLNCNELLVVFDYRMGIDGRSPNGFPISSVYQCKAVIAGANSSIGADWRIVQLDRSTGRIPLPLYRGEPLSGGTSLMVVGHPLGLPMKLASGTIRNRSPDASLSTFVADIDTYTKNSGSPVMINRGNRLEVAGLLTRGHADSAQAIGGKQCARSIICTTPGQCKGEQVTASDFLIPWSDAGSATESALGTLAVPCGWCDDPLRSHHWQCHLKEDGFG